MAKPPPGRTPPRRRASNEEADDLVRNEVRLPNIEEHRYVTKTRDDMATVLGSATRVSITIERDTASGGARFWTYGHHGMESGLVDPGPIEDDEPNSFAEAYAAGRGLRQIFDRLGRVEDLASRVAARQSGNDDAITSQMQRLEKVEHMAQRAVRQTERHDAELGEINNLTAEMNSRIPRFVADVNGEEIELTPTEIVEAIVNQAIVTADFADYVSELLRLRSTGVSLTEIVHRLVNVEARAAAGMRRSILSPGPQPQISEGDTIAVQDHHGNWEAYRVESFGPLARGGGQLTLGPAVTR